MTNSKIEISFKKRILHVKFQDGAVVTKNDLIDIYAFANEQAQGLKYCVLFEAKNNYEVTEDAVEYITNNPSNKDILAKVYILNTKEAVVKTKFHLLIDKPEFKPITFDNVNDGMIYLTTFL